MALMPLSEYIQPSGLAEVDGRSLCGLRGEVLLQVYPFRSFESFPDLLGRCVPAMLEVQFAWVLHVEAVAGPEAYLPGEAALLQAVEHLPGEGIAAGVRFLVDVQLQVLKGGGLVALEHRGPGHSYGGEAHVPQRLRASLSLHQNGPAGLFHFREPLFPV